MIFQTYPRQKYIIHALLNKRKKKTCNNQGKEAEEVLKAVSECACACGVLSALTDARFELEEGKEL